MKSTSSLMLNLSGWRKNSLKQLELKDNELRTNGNANRESETTKIKGTNGTNVR